MYIQTKDVSFKCIKKYEKCKKNIAKKYEYVIINLHKYIYICRGKKCKIANNVYILQINVNINKKKGGWWDEASAVSFPWPISRSYTGKCFVYLWKCTDKSGKNHNGRKRGFRRTHPDTG